MRARLILAAAALAALPLPALAVMSDDDAPPKPTPTSTTCEDGKVWDEASQTCVDAKSDLFDDDTLYRAARELAHAGRYEAAILVASAMADSSGDRALTVLGFAHRKAGRVDLGMDLYARALAQNPDNLLVRAYRGMAYVEMAELALARAELAEIEARGGAGTWPALALAQAIRTGVGIAY